MKHATITFALILGTQLALAGVLADDASAGDYQAPETSPSKLVTVERCYVVADVDEAAGEDVLFVVDKTDTNIATNMHEVGSLGANDVEAMAFDPATKVLYAVDGDQFGTIDITTGAFTPIGETFGKGSGADGTVTFSDVDGLAFDPTTGTLYGSVRRNGDCADDVLIVIDPSTGAYVRDAFGRDHDYAVITPVAGNHDIDDLAIDKTGQMFGIANNAGKEDHLVIIDKLTGEARDVGTTVVSDMEGLAFDTNGQLWSSAGKNNSLHRLDMITGQANSDVALVHEDFTDYEALDCIAVTIDLCKTSPASPECTGKPPIVVPPSVIVEPLVPEYSVTGGGCSASLDSSAGTGMTLLLAFVVLGISRRRRRVAA